MNSAEVNESAVTFDVHNQFFLTADSEYTMFRISDNLAWHGGNADDFIAIDIF